MMVLLLLYLLLRSSYLYLQWFVSDVYKDATL